MTSRSTHRHRGRGKCPEMIRFLDDYVDGNLPRDVAGRFERHLEDCPGCTAFLHTYAAAREAARRTLRPSEVPPALRDRVLAVLREAARKEKEK